MLNEFLTLSGRLIWLGITLAWLCLVGLSIGVTLFFLTDAARLAMEWLTT